MADVTKLLRILNGAQRQVDLLTNTLGVSNIEIGTASNHVTFNVASVTGTKTITVPNTNVDLGDIATNTGNISTNTGNISTNTTDIGNVEAAVGSSTGTAGMDYASTNHVIVDTSAVAAISALDAAVGILNQGSNYTASNADEVGSHLDAIDDALATAGTTDFSDDTFRISDNTTSTKKIAFEASGISASTVRTITMPDTNVDLGEIATNTSSISTNAFNISSNTGNINTNTGNISANTGNISANTSSISDNAFNISSNDTDISTNASNISDNANQISFNATDISTNTSNISDNANQISLNGTDISANTSNIGTNATDISTNTSEIGNNAFNISSNTNDIATNTSSISDNAFNISSNTNDIATNTSSISDNAFNISSNTTDISTNTSSISDNAFNISSNATDISTNTSSIDTNAFNISSNATDISTNTSSIGTNAFNISSNATDISTNTSNISTNADQISGNAGNISTNTGNISTNAFNISSNTGNISINTGNISSNTTAISDHIADASAAHAASAISNTAAGNIVATDVQAAINELDNEKVAISGDTMTGTLAMGANKITSSYVPVDGVDLTNKTYVDNLLAGLSWKDTVNVLKLVGEASETTIEGLSPSAGDSYIVSAVDGDSTIDGNAAAVGDIFEYNGTTFEKIVSNSGGRVPNGTRAILAKSPALISPFTNDTDDNKIVVAVADGGADFDGSVSDWNDTGDAVDKSAVLVQNDAHDSIYDNNGFTLEAPTSVVTGDWVQFTGAATVVAGNALSKTGNTLDVVVDDSSIEINADALRVKAGGIANNEINASAAIDYSKLNLTSNIVNADINASAAIDYSKLNLTGDIVNADINASAAIDYSKLNLTGNIVNADINASAAIATSKLADATEIAEAVTFFGSTDIVAAEAETLTDGSNADSLHSHGVVVKTMTAGEAFDGTATPTVYAIRMSLNGETDTRVYKADDDASSTDKFYVIGLAYVDADIAAGGDIDVVMLGEVTSSVEFTGSQDEGKAVFLGSAGLVTLTASTDADDAIVRIGTVSKVGAAGTAKIMVQGVQVIGVN